MERIERKVLFAIQKCKENDLTKQIIIPLFQKLGFLKVEFYGGIDEKGKDILMWDKDRLGNLNLIVSQVKHFKFTNKSSDERALQTVVNQLIACFTKTVQYSDKTEYIPKEAWLISTFEIDSKSIQTRFDCNLSLIDKKIIIIDGIKLSELLVEHLPEVVTKLIGVDYKINTIVNTTLNNEILLKALGYNKEKEIKNIYTDIDFSLGKTTTEFFFNATFKPFEQIISLNTDEWNSFKVICSEIRSEFTLNFLKNDFETIETNYKKLKIDYDNLLLQINPLKRIIEDFNETINLTDKELSNHSNLNDVLNSVKCLISPKSILNFEPT
jgi:hypothetical protein